MEWVILTVTTQLSDDIDELEFQCFFIQCNERVCLKWKLGNRFEKQELKKNNCALCFYGDFPPSAPGQTYAINCIIAIPKFITLCNEQYSYI